MAVEVRPPELHLVAFTPEDVAGVAERALARLGLADLDVVVELDETTPLTRTKLLSLDPVTIRLESGAVEDPKHPRQLSPELAELAIGLLLLRATDARDPAFGPAPTDEQLSLPQITAWTVHAAGRLAAAGVRVHEPRWRYHFRTRHGFTDVADEIFERLWSGPRLSWAQLADASAQALAARPAVA